MTGTGILWGTCPKPPGPKPPINYYLEDHPKTCEWLITMVGKSLSRATVLFQMAALFSPWATCPQRLRYEARLPQLIEARDKWLKVWCAFFFLKDNVSSEVTRKNTKKSIGTLGLYVCIKIYIYIWDEIY